jgi:hypothetical protein
VSSEARLIVHRRYTTLSNGTTVADNHYEWEGDPSAPVKVPSYVIDYHLQRSGYTPPERIDFLPWPMRLVEASPYFREGIYVRTDRNPLVWMKYRFLFWLRYQWKWFTVRMIRTLDAWDLAKTSRDLYYSWRDVGIKPDGLWSRKRK